MMKLAKCLAEESPDPYKKVCCIALDERDNFLYHGVNGIRDMEVSNNFWADRKKRRKFIIHAEIAMVKFIGNTQIQSVVTTLFPCVHCMTVLAAYHVRQLFFDEMYDKDKPAIAVAAFYNIECIKL